MMTKKGDKVPGEFMPNPPHGTAGEYKHILIYTMYTR